MSAKAAPAPRRRLARAARIITDFNAAELALVADTPVRHAQSFIRDAKRRGHLKRLGRARRGERLRYRMEEHKGAIPAQSGNQADANPSHGSRIKSKMTMKRNTPNNKISLERNGQ